MHGDGRVGCGKIALVLKAALVVGYWRHGKEAHELLRRFDIGITDLIYKGERGF